MKKHPRKIIAISLASLLIASATGMTASAACTSGGESSGGISRNTERASVYIWFCGNRNGVDENSVWHGFDSFGCPSPSVETGTDTEGTQSDSTPAWQIIRQYLDSETLNGNDTKTDDPEEPASPAGTGCSAEQEDTVPAPSDSDGRQTAETSAAEPSSDCQNGTCIPAAEDIPAGSCTVSDGDCTHSCTVQGGDCGTLSDRLFRCLSSILGKYGLNLSGFCLPGCSGTAEAEPAQPAGTELQESRTDGGAAAPAESGNTSVQTDDNGTGTTDNSKIDDLSLEERVAALVNEQRAAYGLAPLTLNAELSDAARAKSQDMHDNRYFDHTSPTYGSPFEMLSSFGISYTAAGENIAMGYATPEAVMEAWMNSSGHRANILNASYTQIGVGYVADGNYWTQEFIG